MDQWERFWDEKDPRSTRAICENMREERERERETNRRGVGHVDGREGEKTYERDDQSR